MEVKNFSGDAPSVTIPAWGWLFGAALILAYLLVMSASGDLLIPYVGQIAAAADYLHELAHDGRHLLGVPCH